MTQENKEDLIMMLNFKLDSLDKKLSREMEDLIIDNNLTTNEYQDATIKEKESLRIQLKELEG